MIEYGPRPTELDITERIDYYKMTMAQLAAEQHTNEQVTFGFKNRSGIDLAAYAPPEILQERLDAIQARGFTAEELSGLAAQKTPSGEVVFSSDYLHGLTEMQLPPVRVSLDNDGQLAIEASGNWQEVTFWETVVLSTVNELYFEGLAADEQIDLFEAYDEGDRRLTDKINRINEFNASRTECQTPIRFADFGTRRHFSTRWQAHVIDRLVNELAPGTLLGSSNVALAKAHDIAPIGTFAHEMPMVYAAMASKINSEVATRKSHSMFLNDWIERYPHLGTALTDTFGTEFFFEDFAENCDVDTWSGLRHDSGNPFEFAKRTIAFYESQNIDPASKTIVFSDGLDLDKIIELHEAFSDRINVVYGWGTNLTNDLGAKALSIVMKAVQAGDQYTVKLSDNPNKFTGPEAEINQYTKIFNYDTNAMTAEALVY